MAKQVITRLLDDLDGGEADETVTFSFDGYTYEVDLSAKNAGKLRDFMATYQEAGTRIGRAQSTGPQMRPYNRQTAVHDNPAVNRELNQKIRAWALGNGYSLADRGRIPQHIVDAYESGTPNPAAKSNGAPNEKAAAALQAELEEEQKATAAKRAATPRQRTGRAKVATKA